MKTPMHVGIVVFVIIPKRIEHRPRLLRRRRAVKVDQGMAVRPLAEDREILADSHPIYAVTGNLVHIIICSARRCAPLYSRTELRLTKDRQIHERSASFRAEARISTR